MQVYNNAEACYHGSVMSNIADVDVPKGWQEWVNSNGVPYYEHTETVSGPCYKPCAPRGPGTCKYVPNLVECSQGNITWEHPSDDVYRAKIISARRGKSGNRDYAIPL